MFLLIEILSWMPEIITYGLTGASVIIAACITSLAITKLDRMSHKREILTAIKAEILHYSNEGKDFKPKELLEDFYVDLEINKNYFVLLPSEANNLVYRSISQNVHVLPKKLIPTIVEFYNSLYSVEAVITVINDPSYKGMGAVQKMKLYNQYLNLKNTAVRMAKHAVKEIKEYEEKV